MSGRTLAQRSHWVASAGGRERYVHPDLTTTNPNTAMIFGRIPHLSSILNASAAKSEIEKSIPTHSLCLHVLWLHFFRTLRASRLARSLLHLLALALAPRRSALRPTPLLTFPVDSAALSITTLPALPCISSDPARTPGLIPAALPGPQRHDATLPPRAKILLPTTAARHGRCRAIAHLHCCARPSRCASDQFVCD